MSYTSDYVKIFGYGSLVNRHTHRPKTDLTTDLRASPVRVREWLRSWSHCVETKRGKVCALTIAQAAGAEVAGVLVPEHRDNLPALDAREQGYQRVRLSLNDSSLVNAANNDEIFTYVSSPAAYRKGSREFPIWRSYLECVLAGFLEFGGHASARDFIVTTEGWEVPILDDRDAPRYMRAVRLSENLRRDIDALIHAHGLDRKQFADPGALAPVPEKRADDEEFG